jgi:hypothetical protein
MLVLIGGSDRVAALLKVPEAGRASQVSAPPPIQIAGTVTLVSNGEQAPAKDKKVATGS